MNELIQTLEFPLHKFAATAKSTAFDFRASSNPMTNEIVWSLVGRFIKEISASDIVEFPANWWQHFKKECFPKWLLKRFPVKTKPYQFDLELVCIPSYEYLKSIGTPFIRVVQKKQGPIIFPTKT